MNCNYFMTKYVSFLLTLNLVIVSNCTVCCLLAYMTTAAEKILLLDLLESDLPENLNKPKQSPYEEFT